MQKIAFVLLKIKMLKKQKKKEEKKEKLEDVKHDTNTGKGDVKNNNKKDIKQGNINDENEDEADMYKACSPKCVSCIIF